MEKEYITITLADDDEDDRLFFTDAFNELKINTKVNTFNNGRELLNHLLKPEIILPNIIFLDLNMPLKNGMECLREIRENRNLNNISVAIYSTSSSENDIEETFINGANIYINKPHKFSDLQAAIERVLQVNWQYQTSILNRDNFLLRI